MAFALKPDRRIERQLRRIAGKQLERAREGLAGEPSHTAIHDARKRVKKVRAILRLVEKEKRPRPRRKAEKRLRRVAHALSRFRDADAIIETFDTLRKRYPRRLPEHTYAIIHRHLAGAKARVDAEARKAHVLERAAAALGRARRLSRRWPLPSIHHRDLARLVKRSYRAARAAMRRALSSNTADDTHRWRKRSKRLWYHVRLLQGPASGLQSLARDLKRLDTLLGDDHNLLVLRTELGRAAHVRSVESGLREVAAISMARQQQLRRNAFAVGRRVYRGRPKQFADRIDEALKHGSRRGARPHAAAA